MACHLAALKEFQTKFGDNPTAEQLGHMSTLFMIVYKYFTSLDTLITPEDTKTLCQLCCKFVKNVIDTFKNETFPADPNIKLFLKRIQMLFRIDNVAPTLLKTLGDRIMSFVLDPSVDFWTGYELVKFLNSTLCTIKVDNYQNIFRDNMMNLWKLMDSLCICGDYEYQSAMLELIINLVPDIGTQKVAFNFFPESYKMQTALTKLNIKTFDYDSRKFLNSVNEENKQVFSIKADSAFAGRFKFIAPEYYKNSLRENKIWIDFNVKSKSVSIQCSPSSLSSDPYVKTENYEVVLVHQNVVKKVFIKSVKETHMLVINLASAMHVLLESSVEIAKKCRTIKLMFTEGNKYKELINHYVPKIFGDSFCEPKKPSDECQYKKGPRCDTVSFRFRPLKINVCSKAAASNFTTISTKSSVIKIASPKESVLTGMYSQCYTSPGQSGESVGKNENIQSEQGNQMKIMKVMKKRSSNQTSPLNIKKDLTNSNKLKRRSDEGNIPISGLRKKCKTTSNAVPVSETDDIKAVGSLKPLQSKSILSNDGNKIKKTLKKQSKSSALIEDGSSKSIALCDNKENVPKIARSKRQQVKSKNKEQNQQKTNDDKVTPHDSNVCKKICIAQNKMFRIPESPDLENVEDTAVANEFAQSSMNACFDSESVLREDSIIQNSTEDSNNVVSKKMTNLNFSDVCALFKSPNDEVSTKNQVEENELMSPVLPFTTENIMLAMTNVRNDQENELENNIPAGKPDSNDPTLVIQVAEDDFNKEVERNENYTETRSEIREDVRSVGRNLVDITINEENLGNISNMQSQESKQSTMKRLQKRKVENKLEIIEEKKQTEAAKSTISENVDDMENLIAEDISTKDNEQCRPNSEQSVTAECPELKSNRMNIIDKENLPLQGYYNYIDDANTTKAPSMIAESIKSTAVSNISDVFSKKYIELVRKQKRAASEASLNRSEDLEPSKDVKRATKTRRKLYDPQDDNFSLYNNERGNNPVSVNNKQQATSKPKQLDTIQESQREEPDGSTLIHDQNEYTAPHQKQRLDKVLKQIGPDLDKLPKELNNFGETNKATKSQRDEIDPFDLLLRSQEKKNKNAIPARRFPDFDRKNSDEFMKLIFKRIGVKQKHLFGSRKPKKHSSKHNRAITRSRNTNVHLEAASKRKSSSKIKIVQDIQIQPPSSTRDGLLEICDRLQQNIAKLKHYVKKL